jgi:hypothetical protein
MARFAMNTIRYGLPVNYYATYLERLEKITAADVQAMAKKYLQPDKCVILVVGNKDEAAAKLARFSGNGSVAFFDRYGNPVADKQMELPAGTTAQNVISRYLTAIGGEAAVRKVSQITTLATGRIEAMGQQVELKIKTMQETPGKIWQEMKMGDMVLSKQVFNGTEGWVSGMGGNQDLKGADLARMRDGAILFPELMYFTEGYQVTLEGMEKIESNDVYRLKVIYPSGTTESEYYDAVSGLKIRKISRAEAQGQSIESTTDYSDYQEIGGVRFPFLMKQRMADQLIEIKVDQVDTNAKIDPALFKK